MQDTSVAKQPTIVTHHVTTTWYTNPLWLILAAVVLVAVFLMWRSRPRADAPPPNVRRS